MGEVDCLLLEQSDSLSVDLAVEEQDGWSAAWMSWRLREAGETCEVEAFVVGLKEGLYALEG